MRSLASRRVLAAVVASVVVATVAATSRLPTSTRAGNPPTRGIDSAFGRLVAELSEPGGYFDSDNIITNEGSYLEVASQLAKLGVRGGAYIGVGPDQNFSYIAIIRPSIAFMLDIRRDNLLEHLLFKAAFELSQDRLEYLCVLLGRPLPADAAAWRRKPLDDILAYVARTPADSATVRRTGRMLDQRIAQFGVTLDGRDDAMIQRYRAEFVTDGLETRYSSLGRNNRYDYPSFGQLLQETDRAGHESSYLASDDAFQFVRSLETSDRVVPVVGNVAGDKAVAAIGHYVASRRLKVSAFYLSNVEQYLMTRDGGFAEFARNVQSLPHDTNSVIIRSYFGRFGRRHPLWVSGRNSTSMIEPIDGFVHRYRAGSIQSYIDLVFNGYVTP